MTKAGQGQISWGFGTCLVLSILGGDRPSRGADKPLHFGFAALTQLADQPGRAVTPADLVALQGVIKPQAGESRWAQIPWMTSLWEARQKAAADGKPLYIWVISDGHPCGFC